jgi:maltose-binding protein MalE
MLPAKTVVMSAVAMMVLVLLSACSPTKKEAAMTPQEARDALTKVITDTSAILGVSGWKDLGAPDVQPCDANGAEGAKYAYSYAAPPGPDHLGDAQKVAEYWKKSGMKVRLVEEPDPSAYATNGPIQALSFSSAPGLYSIDGTSLCVPGDVHKLTSEQAGD